MTYGRDTGKNGNLSQKVTGQPVGSVTGLGGVRRSRTKGTSIILPSITRENINIRFTGIKEVGGKCQLAIATIISHVSDHGTSKNRKLLKSFHQSSYSTLLSFYAFLFLSRNY